MILSSFSLIAAVSSSSEDFDALVLVFFSIVSLDSVACEFSSTIFSVEGEFSSCITVDFSFLRYPSTMFSCTTFSSILEFRISSSSFSELISPSEVACLVIEASFMPTDSFDVECGDLMSADVATTRVECLPCLVPSSPSSALSKASSSSLLPPSAFLSLISLSMRCLLSHFK